MTEIKNNNYILLIIKFKFNKIANLALLRIIRSHNVPEAIIFNRRYTAIVPTNSKFLANKHILSNVTYT